MLIHTLFFHVAASDLKYIDKYHDMLENPHRSSRHSNDDSTKSRVDIPTCRVCVDSSNIFVPLLEGSTILPDLSCLVIQHLYAGIFDSLVGHAGAALYTN